MNAAAMNQIRCNFDRSRLPFAFLSVAMIAGPVISVAGLVFQAPLTALMYASCLSPRMIAPPYRLTVRPTLKGSR
jgi:hypothetical protein